MPNMAGALNFRRAVFALVAVMCLVLMHLWYQSASLGRSGERGNPYAQQDNVTQTSMELEKVAHSLHVWQASLLGRTAAIYNRESRAKHPDPLSPKGWGNEGNAEAEEPEGHSRFDLFDANMECPKGMQLERVGPDGDGGKLICGIETLQAPCTVYSLGSKRDTRFEQAVLQRTPCDIITFDCTVDVEPLNERHRFEKMCIGSKAKAQQDPLRFETIEHSVARLGVAEISLLKMDIEGYEYDVMSAWTKENAQFLPRQVAFELHFGGLYYGTDAYVKDLESGIMFWPRRKVALGELALLGYHLANLGYGIVSREDNTICFHCTELTLYKFL